jgi:hypothetical protein
MIADFGLRNAELKKGKKEPSPLMGEGGGEGEKPEK